MSHETKHRILNCASLIVNQRIHPLEASRGTLNVFFSIYVKISCLPKKYFFLSLDGVSYFFLFFFLRGVVVPSQIALNFSRTYKKLHSKGEPFRFSGSVHRDRQRSCYFIIRIIIFKYIVSYFFSNRIIILFLPILNIKLDVYYAMVSNINPLKLCKYYFKIY